VRQRVARVRRQNPAGRYFQVQVTKTRAHTAPLRLTWTVQRKALRADARWDGVYSVITNLPAETHSPTAVLEIYKDQHQAEGRFRDLNQLPVRVRPLWLKRPDRIEARVFLVMLAALIFALLERQGRRYLAQTGQVIEGLMPEKRDTPTPKGQRLLRALATVSLVQIEEGLRVRLLLSELSPIQRHILQALGLTDLHRSLTGLVQQGGMVSASVPA